MGAAAVLAGEAGTATGGTGGGAGAGEVGTTAGGAPVGPAGTGGFFSPPTGKWTTVCCPSTLITRPIGIFRLSSTKMTSFMFHSSSSIFSGSSFGADRFCLKTGKKIFRMKLKIRKNIHNDQVEAMSKIEVNCCISYKTRKFQLSMFVFKQEVAFRLSDF